MAARLEDGEVIRFECSDVAVRDIDTDHPAIHYSRDGAMHEITAISSPDVTVFHGHSAAHRSRPRR